MFVVNVGKTCHTWKVCAIISINSHYFWLDFLNISQEITSVYIRMFLKWWYPHLTPQVLIIFSRKNNPHGFVGFFPSILGCSPPKIAIKNFRVSRVFFRFRSAMSSGEHPGFPSLPSLSRFDLDMKDALWVLRRADRTNVASPMMLRRYKEPLGTFWQ